MKKISLVFLVFIVALLLFHSTSARVLKTNPGEESSVKGSGTGHAVESSVKTKDDEFSDLMGSSEECEEKEEEEDCLKRRMVEDAHLDYIYTQRHKPKALP